MRSALVREASLAFMDAVRSATRRSIKVVVIGRGYVKAAVRRLDNPTVSLLVRALFIVACCVVLGVPSAARDDESRPATVRLAERVAEQLARLARGRALQVDMPEDRADGAASASDLRALVESRLSGRARVSSEGPRLRLASVLSTSAGRLRLSGRVTDEPEGRLVDLISVSVESDSGSAPLRPGSGVRPATGAIEVTASAVAATLPGPALALAFVGEDRLLALLADAAVLYRRDRLSLARESELPLPARAVVRTPGGLLAGRAGESAFWATTSRLEAAHLLDVAGGRIAISDTADACPWPRSPRGLRFRAATNLLEGTLAGLGEAPLLAAAAGEPGWAVSGAGRLGVVGRGWTDLRVGGAIAPLWRGMAAASSPEPPGSPDAVFVVEAIQPASSGGTPAARIVATIPVDGSVRALASTARGEAFLLAAAVEDRDGTRLVLLEIARAQ